MLNILPNKLEFLGAFHWAGADGQLKMISRSELLGLHFNVEGN
jgi:hypothetical protein